MTALPKGKFKPAIYAILNMGWFRPPIILAPVELCQVEGQPKAPRWLQRDKTLTIFGNLGKLVPTFLSKYWQKYKMIWVSYDGVFCSIYCINVFWFNIQLAKKSYRRQLMICIQNVFLTFSLPWVPKLGVPPKLVYQPQISFRSAPALFLDIA